MTPQCSATARPILSASATACADSPGAGAMTSAHMPSLWTVCATGHSSVCPLGRRARSTASSRVKGTASSTSRLVTVAPPRLPPPPAWVVGSPAPARATTSIHSAASPRPRSSASRTSRTPWPS